MTEKIKKIQKEVYSLGRTIDKHTIDKMTIIDSITNQEIIFESTKSKINELLENSQRL